MMNILNSILLVIATIVLLIVALVYLVPGAVTRFALNSERKRSGLIRKDIDLSNGLHFAYLEGGKGEPLLLLHGFGGNKDTFTRVARFLINDYRVIIPDIIGFGESSHPSQADYSPSRQVEQLRAFLQVLGVEKIHLGGNSMGAQIAMVYSSLYPAEVKSLWLLSPAGVWNAAKTDVLRSIIETGRNSLIARNTKEFKQVMAIGMRKPPYIPRPMLNVLAQERIQNAVLEEHIFQQLMECSVEKLISGIETQTLIVIGNQDRVISAESIEILGNLLPNSKTIIMPDIGHVPMFENPKACAEDYLRFMKSAQNH
jgi:pimeloyl-ACP methyl ester carboxylesterase